MSALDRILDGIEVDLAPFALCEVRGHGRLNLGKDENALLHYVLAGKGWITLADQRRIPLGTGSLAIVPANQRHLLEAERQQSTELPTCEPMGEDWTLHRVGFGKGGLLVVCGRISASYRGVRGIFDFLPRPVVADLGGPPEARAALEQLVAELARPGPGSRALARSLLLQCLILVLRRKRSEIGETLGWLGAIEHAGIWPAVKVILERPEDAHSLERLAAAAGMSRSAFAEHFKAVMGRGPMDLVRETRLRQAARLLRDSKLPVKAIAGKIGYASRSYFSRAFQASYGMAPADYRLSRQKRETQATRA